MIAAVLLEIGASALFVTNESLKRGLREEDRAGLLHVAEAGVQAETNSIWQNFKAAQTFAAIDTQTSAASNSNPCLTVSSVVTGQQRYTVSVVGYQNPDSYHRILTFLAVGWLDSNNNGMLDASEPRRAFMVQVEFSLSRAGVFDYTYFVNNYGWMQGFSSTDLVVNGDMRANGNFDFSGGTPTINGSVYAAANNLLIPPAPGIVNITPNQWSDSYYASNASSRCRQAYNASQDGAYGSSEWNQWQDVIYDQNGGIYNGTISGAVVGDSKGIRTYSGQVLDPDPTSVLTMPDLSNMSVYTALSNSYLDTIPTFPDGTTNPNYNKGAYLEVWNSTTNQYNTLSTNGVVNGSAVAIGTSSHPVLIHGPVTVSTDIVIKGNVSGQGALYAGRNVQIVGSIVYQNPPSFKGSNPQTIDNSNAKQDMLALAASGSIIMGDTSQFGNPYPLEFMGPPFTNPRYDSNGNYIPAFNATSVDSYGVMKYQSVLGDSFIHSVASGINQIDAVLYTNFVGGGDLGTSGGGVTFNGSIISKDEAMVLWSLPFTMNYDNRIKERSLTSQPLIDINLPRTPSVQQLTWQEVTD